MLAGRFAPGFRVALHHKDLKLCQALARELGVSLPMIEMTLVHYQRLIDAGFGPEDAQTVVPVRGEGCDRCNRTGYKGRVGLYEVMEVNEQLREMILVGSSALELRRKAVDEGMITLRRSGLMKVTEGVTTIEEVARETVK